jgi:hypothetical protein
MGVTASVNITNNFGAITAEIRGRLTHGLDLAAERGKTLAVERSPWDQGTLAGSHTVEHATSPEKGAQVVADTPYAARLHDHPEYNFSTDSNPNAQGKWVEEAILDAKSELGRIVAKEVRNG